MKTFVSSKLICVLGFSMLSVLFTASTAQAHATCCCCVNPQVCFPYDPGLPPFTCSSGCKDINPCNEQDCVAWCITQMDRPDDEEIIESFMSKEYIDEVIAMDEECLDEEDEVVEE